MKKTALLAPVFVLVSANAHADTLYLHCFRYESKCALEKCYEVSKGLSADQEWRNDMPAEKMGSVDYVIRDHEAISVTLKATEGANISGDKYVTLFKSITQDDSQILIEHKNEAGFAKEKIIIEKRTGFYSNYLLHTDSTIKDTPVGEPFTAYFGWCIDTTETNGVYTPKPTEQKSAPTTPTAPPIATTPTSPEKP